MQLLSLRRIGGQTQMWVWVDEIRTRLLPAAAAAVGPMLMLVAAVLLEESSLGGEPDWEPSWEDVLLERGL